MFSDIKKDDCLNLVQALIVLLRICCALGQLEKIMNSGGTSSPRGLISLPLGAPSYRFCSFTCITSIYLILDWYRSL